MTSETEPIDAPDAPDDSPVDVPNDPVPETEPESEVPAGTEPTEEGNP